MSVVAMASDDDRRTGGSNGGGIDGQRQRRPRDCATTSIAILVFAAIRSFCPIARCHCRRCYSTLSSLIGLGQRLNGTRSRRRCRFSLHTFRPLPRRRRRLLLRRRFAARLSNWRRRSLIGILIETSSPSAAAVAAAIATAAAVRGRLDSIDVDLQMAVAALSLCLKLCVCVCALRHLHNATLVSIAEQT